MALKVRGPVGWKWWRVYYASTRRVDNDIVLRMVVPRMTTTAQTSGIHWFPRKYYPAEDCLPSKRNEIPIWENPPR